MNVRIGIIIPTIGRSTLGRAIKSAIEQIGANDAIYVVPDVPRENCYGHVARNIGMRRAGYEGMTHLCFLDDDDVMRPGAIAAIRAACVRTPRALILFGLWIKSHEMVKRPTQGGGNAGTGMIVCPAGVPANWEPGYDTDQKFASRLAKDLPVVYDPFILQDWCHDANA